MARLSEFKAGDRLRFLAQFHAPSIDGTASALGVPPQTEGTVVQTTDEGIAVKIRGWKNLLWVSDGNAVEKI